jgi:hypothetical protein
MRRVMVRYKVKADRAVENERYIAAVFEQLARERPAGLRYASFRLDDGVSFVHIAEHDDASVGNPLAGLTAFKTFTAAVRDRCEEPPVTSALQMIGSYRLFDP